MDDKIKSKKRRNVKLNESLRIGKKPKTIKDQTSLLKKTEELTILDRITQKVTAQLSLQKACNIAIKELSVALGTDVAVLFLQEGGELHLKAVGPTASYLQVKTAPLHIVGECLCGLAAQNGRMIFSHNIHQDRRCTWSECKKAGLCSFAAIPLHIGKEQVGVLGIASARERDFKQTSRFLKKVADRLAISLHHARLLEQTRTYAVQLEQQIAERKKTEKELSESERRYRTLYEGSRDGYAMVNMEGTIIESNTSFQEMLGYTDEELPAKTYADITPSTWHPIETRILEKQVMKRGYSDIYEKEYIRKNGTIFPIEIRTYLLRGEDGNPQGMWAFVRDITERKKAEEEIKMLSSVVEQSTEGMAIADLEGALIFINETWCRMHGYKSPKELLGKSLAISHNQEQLEHEVKPFNEKVMEFGTYSGEVGHITKDGKPFPTLMTSTVLKDKQGKPYALVGIAKDITELKQSEKALQKSEARLKLQIDRMPIGCIIWDPEFRVVYWNPAAENIFGFTVSDAIGKHPYNIIVPRDAQTHIDNIWHRLLEGDATAHSVNENITKDGRIITCYWTNTPLKETDGSIIGVLSMVQDITEHKKAEDELKASEERFRAISNTAYDAILVMNEDGKITYWNTSAERMFGYKDKEAIGKDLHLLIAPERYHEDFKKGFGRFQKTGQGPAIKNTIEFNAVRKDRTEFPIEVSTSAIQINRQWCAVGIVRDITERKKAADALLTSEAELHDHYFTQAAINMILSESIKNIPLEEFFQKALNMILSIPWGGFEAIGSISLVEDKADALMMKAQSNIPEPLKELCVRVPFGKCLCGKAALTQKIEFAYHIDERHEICYEGMVPHGHYSVPILSGGRTLGVLNIYLKEGHIRDQKEEEFLNTVANTLAGIIMRKRAEEEKEKLHAQLLQAQKMEAVGQLSGGIAHDFNNILTAIIGYGNLLKMEIEKDSRLSTYIKNILDSAGRAANLTQDLLAFSRKQMISPKPINVNEVIKGAEKILLRLIGADIELSTHLSDRNLTVMADSTQMENVLMNLATNARDAMPGGGNLRISSDVAEIDERFINMYGYGEKGKYAVMTVSDTGVGIDEQTKDKIFEPFFTTKEVGKGTGLGLAMVYGIVKQHDGFINVYSEPGKGTTFKIYLPLIHAEIIETKEIELPISKGGIETILVAEDDAMARKFLREVLEDAGYTVIEAKDGEDAIDVFIENKDRIQLLILDVIMPKKNGKEVYETLKESSPPIKALFISGYSAAILHKKGIVSEGPEVILKPISSDNLLRKIRDLLDK